jgi:hypothetical protein
MGSCRECCEHQGQLILTFKALGPELPTKLLALANEVIE